MSVVLLAMNRLEAASAGLGHASLDVTEIYAEQDLKRAMRVARRVG